MAETPASSMNDEQTQKRKKIVERGMALVKEEWPRPVYLRPGISVLVQIFEETRSNRTKRGRCVPILPRASYELFTYGRRCGQVYASFPTQNGNDRGKWRINRHLRPGHNFLEDEPSLTWVYKLLSHDFSFSSEI